ncbi:hypothetical protein [Coxiella endosymbiont of Ornithodoros amblus]|uniref:hypothetical protein n=1 Tax=Coxiella endosymbiont of Ornithodoros amblus TaxID=1656166 RepID=UPI00244E0865|nr:hypothetical protein [Coxiella endosymbiont of Ornithodoros amblus]
MGDEDTDGKYHEKMTGELSPLTQLVIFLGNVEKMNLFSTVLEGLGGELKLI